MSDLPFDKKYEEALIEARRYVEWPELRPSSRITLLITEEFLRLVDAQRSATATIPEHLKPHEELRAIADKCMDATPAHWTSGDKLALLGFVRLHVAYHEMQEAALRSPK